MTLRKKQNLPCLGASKQIPVSEQSMQQYMANYVSHSHLQDRDLQQLIVQASSS